MKSKAVLLAVGAFASGALVGALIEHKTEIIRYLRAWGARGRVSDTNVQAPTEPNDVSGWGGISRILLTDDQARRMGIQTRPAACGPLRIELELPGEVCVNQDRLVRVTPQVVGVVKEVRKDLGDTVAAGEVVAVLESQDLADAKRDYQIARASLVLAEADCQRQEQLCGQQASSEQEYLCARQTWAEERIRLRSSQQKLQALGLSPQELDCLAADTGEPLTLYNVVAPSQGTVVEKHMAAGEPVCEAPLLTVADLRTVWVLVGVPEQDIPKVGKGQTATIQVNAFPSARLEGEVIWVSSTVEENTRTLPLRVAVDNAAYLLKPGMLARVFLAVDVKKDAFLVPRESLRTHEDTPVVFVDCGRGRYEMRPVRVGLRSCTAVEILDGVRDGESVVTEGGDALLTELPQGCVAGG